MGNETRFQTYDYYLAWLLLCMGCGLIHLRAEYQHKTGVFRNRPMCGDKECRHDR